MPALFIFSASESEASVLKKCQMTKQLNSDLLQPHIDSLRICVIFLPKCISIGPKNAKLFLSVCWFELLPADEQIIFDLFHPNSYFASLMDSGDK